MRELSVELTNKEHKETFDIAVNILKDYGINLHLKTASQSDLENFINIFLKADPKNTGIIDIPEVLNYSSKLYIDVSLTDQVRYNGIDLNVRAYVDEDNKIEVDIDFYKEGDKFDIFTNNCHGEMCDDLSTHQIMILVIIGLDPSKELLEKIRNEEVLIKLNSSDDYDEFSHFIREHYSELKKPVCDIDFDVDLDIHEGTDS
jgi:hypothetical protein